MKKVSLLLALVFGLVFMSCKKEQNQVEVKTGILQFTNNSSENSDKMIVKSDRGFKYCTTGYTVVITDTEGYMKKQVFENVDLNSSLEIKYNMYSLVDVYHSTNKDKSKVITYSCLYDRRDIKLKTEPNGDLSPIYLPPYSIAVKLKVVDKNGNDIPRTEYHSFLKNSLYDDTLVHHDLLDDWVYLNYFEKDIKYFFRVYYKDGEIRKDYQIGKSWEYDSEGNIKRGVSTTIITGIDFKGEGFFKLGEIK